MKRIRYWHMKLLHVSNEGIPDTRVEKAAWTGRKKGFTVSLACPSLKRGISSEIPFDQIYTLPFNRLANVKIPIYIGGI